MTTDHVEVRRRRRPTPSSPRSSSTTACSSCPIVEDGKVGGIVTRADFFRALAERVPRAHHVKGEARGHEPLDGQRRAAAAAVPAHGGRELVAPAPGDDRRARLGELAAEGLLRRPVAHGGHDRHRLGGHHRGPAALGQRRADGRSSSTSSALEIRASSRSGELRDRRAAAVPALAALGGMVVPGAAVRRRQRRRRGRARLGHRRWRPTSRSSWACSRCIGPGLPAAGARVPAHPGDRRRHRRASSSSRSSTPRASISSPLAAAAGSSWRSCLLGRVRVWRGPAYFVAGLALWVAMVESGVHPTIAGVAARAAHPGAPAAARARSSGRRCSTRVVPPGPVARAGALGDARRRRGGLAQRATAGAAPPLDELRRRAAVRARQRRRPARAATRSAARVSSPITIGIVVGLVAGKTIGISLASFLAVRLGLGTLPRGMTMRHVLGAAALAGIGFTVSLFVADLAFDDEVLRDEAKVGVLAASVLAAALGWLLFRLAAHRRRRGQPGRRRGSIRPVDRAHDHIRGPLDAPLSLVEYGDCGVPVLRRRDRRRRRAAQALRRPAAVRLPPPAARGPPPARPPGRRGDGGGRRAGALLGDARPAVRRAGPARSSTISSATRRRSAWMRSASWRRCATTCTRRRSTRTSTARSAAASPGRRRSSSTASG